MKKLSANPYFGKYREIIMAVALFLVFDLAILILNFYISFQISEDALAINLAGRQRMLSQRMTKALLTAEHDLQVGTPNDNAIDELVQTVTLFDSTLSAFETGGTVTGGEGKPVYLTQVLTPDALMLINEARLLWLPFRHLLTPLKSGADFNPEQLHKAVNYARENNIKLLNLMNNFTSKLEQAANAKADRLRQVQTAGILLALMNFAFILFKFIRRLREKDRIVELAQKETAEILSTVKEGLFLLDAKYRFGSQQSASLTQIFGTAIEPGSDFLALLRKMVSPDVFTSACDYISLLFGDRVKEALVTELNPLNAVEMTLSNNFGTSTRRYLTLQFNRVLQDGEISHLLVTVFDVTTQIELERDLLTAKKKAKAEISVMLDLLKIEPSTLIQFLNTAEKVLLGINEQLRSVGAGPADYRQMINNIFREIHTLKGEAATLSLDLFEDLAQQFESLLAGLRSQGTVTGDALIAIPLPLDEFFERITTIRDLIARLASYNDAFAPRDNSLVLSDNFRRLVQRIARDQGKEIKFSAELDLFNSLPDSIRTKVKNITVQLLRNAVTHGIESVHERVERSKPRAGNIFVALKAAESGEYELVLRDDGCGLVPQRIRNTLLSSGRYSANQLNELGDKQIIMKIFEPGFTTIGHASHDAGHGVGMDVVKQKIQQLGAQLQISTRENVFTQFSIRFAA